MRVAIVGAGAVGCYFGAMFARAGTPVTLIGRPALVEAVAENGLILEKDGKTEVLPAEASTEPEAVKGAGLVLVCVKSPDTATAGKAIRRHLAPGATVMSLQNGIGNAEILAEILDRPVLPAVVYVAAALAGPGHVLHRGRGDLVLGEGPGAQAAAARFRAVQVPAEVSPQADSALWTKLTLNCALNAISALTLRDYGTIATRPEARATFSALVEECRAVAAASGVTLPADMLERVMALTVTMPAQLSSTAQDVMAGKRTEIAQLNGDIARRGAAFGVPTPLNRALAMMVGLLEES
ncbi:ketopantoate reductase family protein [Pararhodobacter sp.]|uniref:ketopantoate reductase family protein n=1 Tax=Pararhodobacter sp. TaxID=2127056 RepID=UPI002FE3E381